jgi:hypothetical protein
MVKLTLLKIVQEILNDMDGDNVNDISETVESEQVASIVRSVFREMTTALDFPHQMELFTLVASGDSSIPTHMSMPDSISKIEWIKYDVREDVADPIVYQTVGYLPPYEFVSYCSMRDSSDTTNIMTVTDLGGVPLLIRKDQSPRFWTSFDDEHIVFDAYLSDVDSTLQSSKTLCYGTRNLDWVHENDAVPDLPEQLFGLFVAQAKATAFSVMKGTNPKLEKKERRMTIRSNRNKWRQRMTHEGVDYGRPTK